MKKVILSLLAAALAVMAQAQYVQPSAEKAWRCPGQLLRSYADPIDRMAPRTTEATLTDAPADLKLAPSRETQAATPGEAQDGRLPDLVRKAPEASTLQGVDREPVNPRP